MAVGKAIIGALRIILGADTALFDKGLSGAEKRLQRFAGDMKKAGSLIAGALSVAAIVAATKSAAKYGAELDDTSQRLGINVERLQELSHAALMAGVSQEDFSKALEQMNKRLGEVKAGTTAAEETIGKLGLTMADIKGKSPDEAFKLIAQGISRIKDPMQQASIAAELFGKAGAKLLPILKEGSVGLAKWADEARRMGFILSEETIKKAAEADDEFDRIGKSLKVAGVNITVGFLPALTKIRELMTSPEFQDGVKKFGENLGTAVMWMVSNKDTILQVSAALAGAFVGAKAGRLAGPGGAVMGAVMGGVAGLAGAEPDRAPLQITVHPSAKPKPEPEIDANAANNARLIAEQMRELAFKTQLARGEFQLLADGFPELVHGMKIFGQSGAEGRVTVETLSPALQRLNEQMLLFKGAQLTQENLAPWDAYEQKLARIQELLDKQIITGDVAARASRKAAEATGQAWDIAASSISGSFASAFNDLGKNNKTMAKLGQAFAIFQATVNTYTAASKAWALYGPTPLGYAGVAAALAVGFAQVANIKSQKMPAFATGGAVRVPQMFSGSDSQLFQARVSPGEQIDIWRPGEGPDPRRGAAGGGVADLTLRFADRFSREFWAEGIAQINRLAPDGYRLKVAAD